MQCTLSCSALQPCACLSPLPFNAYYCRCVTVLPQGAVYGTTDLRLTQELFAGVVDAEIVKHAKREGSWVDNAGVPSAAQ